MTRLRDYLRAVMHDPHYPRVCVALFALAWLAAGGVIFLYSMPATNALEWFALLFPLALMACGGFFLYVALGSERTFERVMPHLNEGGDLPGLILLALIVLVAVPVTMAVRGIRRAGQGR